MCLKGSLKKARSKLGTYFEKGPNGESSLFEFAFESGSYLPLLVAKPRSTARGGSEVELSDLMVLVGDYAPGFSF